MMGAHQQLQQHGYNQATASSVTSPVRVVADMEDDDDNDKDSIEDNGASPLSNTCCFKSQFVRYNEEQDMGVDSEEDFILEPDGKDAFDNMSQDSKGKLH